MSYDSRCYDLAEVFLSSQATEKHKDELAQAIQTCIEDWIEGERERIATELKIPLGDV